MIQNNSKDSNGPGTGLFGGIAATSGDYANSLDSLGSAAEKPVSIYIHVPFGTAGFTRNEDSAPITVNDQGGVENFLKLVEEEVRSVAERIGVGRQIRQLHLGGQSPNALSKKHLVQLFAIFDRYFSIEEDTECSMSASAAHVSPSHLDLISGLGFDRIDFGLCEFEQSVQTALGQVQSTDMVREVFEMSRNAGIEVVTSNLVYGLPQQTTDTMRQSLKSYLELQPERIHCSSASSIAVTGSASFNPSLADKMAVFNVIIETLTSNGYRWVGLDCFARESDSLVSAQERGTLYRNRIGYTGETIDNCIGVGLSAQSDVGQVSAQNHSHLHRWADALSSGELPVSRGLALSESEARQRRNMNLLMCNLSRPRSDIVTNQVMNDLASRNLIDISDADIRITNAGRMALGHMWSSVLPTSIGYAIN